MKPTVITSVLCLLLFAGCSGDEGIPVERQDNRVPLSIVSASVENTGESLTRAVTPELLTSGSIGIFLEGASAATSYTKKDNIQYNYSASGWVPNQEAETLYLSGEDAHVCAYYKTTKINLTTKETAALTSQIFDAEKDLLYAKNKTVNGTSAGKVVEFVLGHAYSQIEFVLSRDNYPNTCKVTQIAVKNANIIGSTTLNLATGVYAAGTANANFSYNTNSAAPADGITVPATGTVNSNLLMIPCTLAADAAGTGLTLVLTIDGKTMTAKVPLAKLSALKAGIKHQLSVVIKGTAISVGVKTTPWDPVSVDGNYNPEPLAVSATIPAHIATRAQTPVELTEGSMGIFRLAANDYAALENIRYNRAAGEDWKPASTTIYVGAKPASLCAYSPYGAAGFSAAAPKTTATLTAQPYTAAKDMSYATTGGSEIWKLTPQATFEMKRAYSRLKLAVTRDASYPNTCKVTKVVLTPQSGMILTANTLDISTGTTGSGTPAANYETAITTTISTAGVASGTTDDSSIDLLMIPQALASAGGLKVTLTVDGIGYSAVVPADKLGEFTAGNLYTVSLTLKGKAVEIEGVNITKEWTTAAVGSGSKDAVFD